MRESYVGGDVDVPSQVFPWVGESGTDAPSPPVGHQYKSTQLEYSWI